MQEEGISIDMFVIGSWAVNRQGSQQWNDSGITRLQWLILADRGFLNKMTPVITVVHSCQVIEEEDEEDNPNLPDDMQCDYVITPEEVIRTDGHEKFDPSGPWFDKLHDLLIHMTPPLQELKGIKMMEKIMGESGLPKGIKIAASKIPDSEEQMGMEIATRIIQGYKV
jgi:5-formyltetrahydrofolate cyclo-ligase